MRDDPAVWLGLDNPEAKILKPGEGWLPMPIPEDSEIFINGRMHLTQSQVRALLPALMHFAENGFLPDPDQHPKAG